MSDLIVTAKNTRFDPVGAPDAAFQSHFRYDVDIEEPSTDRVGLFNNFGNNGKGGSLFVKGHSVQVVENNFFGSGRALDIQAPVSLFSQNTLASVESCQPGPAVRRSTIMPSSTLTTAVAEIVNDLGFLFPLA